jgi:hypothetical protein
MPWDYGKTLARLEYDDLCLAEKDPPSARQTVIGK